MIKVLKAGLHSSIQDKGRIGYRNFGVPLSGCMDVISAEFGNALLNNPKNAAVLEITLQGPELLFSSTTNLVITGAEISPKINNITISNYKIYQVKNGDILSFGKLIKGVRAYLAISGGFQSETVLNSKSFYNEITRSAVLQKNDEIETGIFKVLKYSSIGVVNNKIQFYETNQIEVFKGPEFELFSTQEQQIIFATLFKVSTQNNRMGYRLEETVVKHSKSIITSPVLPGTVQLTPSGQLIVLMKDAQTTGGYPRIFQLSDKSIAILAQKKAGDFVQFLLINEKY